MRTVTISCDRCGKVIEGYPVCIMPEYIDRETGGIRPDDEEKIPDWAEEMLDKDFCEECTKKIVRYAIGGMKENPDFKKAVDEMVNGSVKKKDQEEEADREADPKEKPAGRQKLDAGKIMALTKAGWNAQKIAEEMGVNAQAIYDVRYRLKKEGKL